MSEPGSDGLPSARRYVTWCAECDAVHCEEQRSGRCQACDRPLGQPARDEADLFRAYAGQIRAAVRFLAASWGVPGEWADTEDVVQDTFMALYRSTGIIRKPRAWLVTVACRQASRAVRGQRATIIGGAVDQADSGLLRWSSVTPVAGISDAQVEGAVIAGIGALPEKQKVATYLDLFEGWSRAEIAGYLQVAASTAGVHAWRGARRVRQSTDWTPVLLPAAILARVRKAAKRGIRLITQATAHAGSGIHSMAASTAAMAGGTAPVVAGTAPAAGGIAGGIVAGTALAAGGTTRGTLAGSPLIFAAIAGVYAAGLAAAWQLRRRQVARQREQARLLDRIRERADRLPSGSRFQDRVTGCEIGIDRAGGSLTLNIIDPLAPAGEALIRTYKLRPAPSSALCMFRSEEWMPYHAFRLSVRPRALTRRQEARLTDFGLKYCHPESYPPDIELRNLCEIVDRIPASADVSPTCRPKIDPDYQPLPARKPEHGPGREPGDIEPGDIKWL